MEYDKRIDDRDMILNCLDVEFCKRKTFSSGYFADDIDNYSDLSTCKYGKLTYTTNQGVYAYQKDGKGWFAFFLPDCAVKKEKKYIPFKYLKELLECGIQVGRAILIRNNSYPEINTTVLISEINYNPKTDEVIDIALGTTVFEFGTLFKSYSFYNGDSWQPFGVEKST